MAHITEQLLYSTVRLEGSTVNGNSVGTGFFFQDKDRLYLVTNKHVIEKVTQGKYLMKQRSQRFWDSAVLRSGDGNISENEILTQCRRWLN